MGQQLERIFTLADELLRLRNQKEALEDQLTEIGKQINSVDYKLCELMTETKTRNFTRDGLQFIMTTKTRASALADAKEDLFVELRARGYGDIITETVNSNSLSAFVKEQIEQNDECIPDWLDGLVSVFDKVTCTVRKASAK